MSVPARFTETPITLRLSEDAHAMLTQRAAAHKQDIATAASELIERAAARPSVDEALAPFRRQVAASGMSDEQLDEFFRQEIEAHRREKKAVSP